jgi:peptidoglycan/xylan/chitin deacetylase (PgdA/CDA1 family)
MKYVTLIIGLQIKSIELENGKKISRTSKIYKKERQNRQGGKIVKSTIKIYKSVKLLFFFSLCILVTCIGIVTYGMEKTGTNQSEKIVYLTFDDGPIPKITERILDVLKEENVKATFFVVGKEIPKREQILRRIDEEGHTIGLHTYSHKFKHIYSSQTAFIEEMEQTSALINQVLGKELNTKIIRFPGGSKGNLNESFYQLLTQKGYKIFDWNVNLEDGINPNLSPSRLLANVKKSKNQDSIKIILAHTNSNNKNTCIALPSIIQHYKKQGYTFKAIDETTVPYFYKYKKKDPISK